MTARLNGGLKYIGSGIFGAALTIIVLFWTEGQAKGSLVTKVESHEARIVKFETDHDIVIGMQKDIIQIKKDVDAILKAVNEKKR